MTIQRTDPPLATDEVTTLRAFLAYDEAAAGAARPNGHADLLREAIDGQVGE